MRLELNGNLAKNLKYDLTLYADKWGQTIVGSDKVGLYYGYVDYKFADTVGLRVGKAKLPYSRVSLTSSSVQLLVDRPVSTEATKPLFDDYLQPHLMFHGKFLEGILTYNIAFGDGWTEDKVIIKEPSTIVHKADPLYVARVELSPPGWIEEKKSDAHLGNGKHLTIGANYAAQQGIGYKVTDYEEDRTLTGFDISGHWNAITGQFEYNTWNEEYTDPSKSDKEPNGWYVQAGYFMDGPNIEPVVRYEVYDQDSNSDDKEEKTTTLGVNWYGKGHSFKVGMNWAHTEYDKGVKDFIEEKKDIYQVQAQLYF